MNHSTSDDCFNLHLFNIAVTFKQMVSENPVLLMIVNTA